MEYDLIVNDWKSRDRVAKFLGIYTSRRLYNDWTTVLPSEKARKEATWSQFKKLMCDFYKPTEKLTLQFQCDNEYCTARDTAARDQIVIGLLSEEIREEALKNAWDISNLRKEGMRIESAFKGASEIAGDTSLNKIYGIYSRKNSKREETKPRNEDTSCYFCGITGKRRDILIHAKKCPARASVCSNCNLTGHYAKMIKIKHRKTSKRLTKCIQMKREKKKYTMSTCLELTPI